MSDQHNTNNQPHLPEAVIISANKQTPGVLCQQHSSSSSSSLHQNYKSKGNRRNNNGFKRKRRFAQTQAHNNKQQQAFQHQKKRRKNNHHQQQQNQQNKLSPPNFFLMGGDIHDPLNLKSIDINDDVQSQPSSQSSPSSCSSHHHDHKEKVEVLIPPNIHDPLNLACPDELLQSDLLPVSNSSNSSSGCHHNQKNIKRHKHRRTSSETEIISMQTNNHFNKNVPMDRFKDDSFVQAPPLPHHHHQPHQQQWTLRDDQIVSPVVVVPPSVIATTNTHQHAHATQCSTHNCNIIINPARKRPNEVSQHCPKGGGGQASLSSAANSAGKNSKNFRKDRFQYGNYNRYYGYRNGGVQEVDPRIKLFAPDFFHDKDVLDIGCNVGHVTLAIARDYHPRKIVGVDIDLSLVEAANNNIRHYCNHRNNQKSNQVNNNNQSQQSCSGEPGHHQNIIPEQQQQQQSTDSSSLMMMNTTISSFPANVSFKACNYVPQDDQFLNTEQAEYDCILCLSVTKWVHLNWGDVGVKRLFQRIFLQLRPGGCLVLEPQPWSSYHKKAKMTPKILELYKSIRFKPEHFNEFLLKDVGFRTCEFLGTPEHNSKGFQRPIYLYVKPLK